jgi:peptidoglycan/xylan/chitin deacetylase (PgdA/CDA1 family)
MRIALRVEVRSERGLKVGVPALMRLFNTYQVRASFFFPLGLDLAGFHPLYSWRGRTWLGLSAMLSGTLRRAPDLTAESLRLCAMVRDNGHDVGLSGGSPWEWTRKLAFADQDWVDGEIERLITRFTSAGESLPTALATPDWQVHPGLLLHLGDAQFRYSSITRGKMPYRPVLQGCRSSVPEIPTTLPTVDELLSQAGVDAGNVHQFLYAESQRVLPAGHVFAVTAEREGQDRLELMEKMLVMWKDHDGGVRALDDVLKQIEPNSLPCHQVGWTTPEGASCAMAAQSIEVPA